LREKLKEHSFNQSQITDASELVVFASKTKITKTEIESFARLNTEIRQKDSDSEQKQVKRLSSYIENFETEAFFNWTSRQAYIAMGILLASAAQLKIDSCPMEGIQGREYDRILDLEPLNLRTISVVALGYRSEEDSYQWEPKVRKPLNDLISMI
jgi:nitroreductase